MPSPSPNQLLCCLLLIAVATTTTTLAYFEKAATTTNPSRHLSSSLSSQEEENGSSDSCFCQLSGRIDECTCNIDTVDHFNNIKIYPRITSLLTKDYFRFFKVNLKRQCPFWVDDSKCAMKYCHVEQCVEQAIPQGIKGAARIKRETSCDDDEELDFLNTTLTLKNRKDFALWLEHDNAQQDNFCVFDENDEDDEYVDLLLNPERFTGYRGVSANRIWNSIYLENCFRPKNNKLMSSFHISYIQANKLKDMCLEERVYYRAISGLHASINIHLCADYLLSNGPTLAHPKGEWGPNLDEFQRRFSPETTNGEGPQWLRNLYFVYLLELRALAKATPYLTREQFYTGSDIEDFDTQMAVKDLLSVVGQFGQHFDETTMFNGGRQEALRLKQEFRDHFRNVTQIMDCVGCDKCKLWGKLQTRGLGTALKILFSSSKLQFQLQREEIVALFNAFGRLATSIYKLDDFRQMLHH